MPTARISRAASAARDEILTQLKEDHKRVKKAYREFEKLHADVNSERCEEIVQMVLDELTVHAAIEEELLYPAARAALMDDDLIDEAEVEHESVHTLMDQLRGMTSGDDKYAAHFTVLCEYVMHHVKEEEAQMFPQLESVKLDWEALASQMSARRTELMEETSEGMESADDTDPDDEDSDEPTTAPMDPSRGQANTVGGKAAKHTTQSRARA